MFDDPSGPGVYAALDVEGWSDTGFLAVSGGVQLGAVTATTTTGTFDVVLGDGEHISGWFDAPRCATVPPGVVP